MTRQRFIAHARKLLATLRGQAVELQPDRLTGGRLGWQFTDTIVEVVDGRPLKCKLTLRVTVLKSSQWPEQ